MSEQVKAVVHQDLGPYIRQLRIYLLNPDTKEVTEAPIGDDAYKVVKGRIYKHPDVNDNAIMFQAQNKKKAEEKKWDIIKWQNKNTMNLRKQFDEALDVRQEEDSDRWMVYAKPVNKAVFIGSEQECIDHKQGILDKHKLIV